MFRRYIGEYKTDADCFVHMCAQLSTGLNDSIHSVNHTLLHVTQTMNMTGLQLIAWCYRHASAREHRS